MLPAGRRHTIRHGKRAQHVVIRGRWIFTVVLRHGLAVHHDSQVITYEGDQTRRASFREVVGQASHTGHRVHVPRIEPLRLCFHLRGIPSIAEPGPWYEPCFELQHRGQLGFPDAHETNAIKVDSAVPLIVVKLVHAPPPDSAVRWHTEGPRSSARRAGSTPRSLWSVDKRIGPLTTGHRSVTADTLVRQLVQVALRIEPGVRLRMRLNAHRSPHRNLSARGAAERWERCLCPPTSEHPTELLQPRAEFDSDLVVAGGKAGNDESRARLVSWSWIRIASWFRFDDRTTGQR
jgi:hypothetical protein